MQCASNIHYRESGTMSSKKRRVALDGNFEISAQPIVFEFSWLRMEINRYRLRSQFGMNRLRLPENVVDKTMLIYTFAKFIFDQKFALHLSEPQHNSPILKFRLAMWFDSALSSQSFSGISWKLWKQLCFDEWWLSQNCCTFEAQAKGYLFGVVYTTICRSGLQFWTVPIKRIPSRLEAVTHRLIKHGFINHVIAVLAISELSNSFFAEIIDSIRQSANEANPRFIPRIDEASCPVELIELCDKCWSVEPAKRPNMVQIRAFLKDLGKQL